MTNFDVITKDDINEANQTMRGDSEVSEKTSKLMWILLFIVTVFGVIHYFRNRKPTKIYSYTDENGVTKEVSLEVTQDDVKDALKELERQHHAEKVQ